MAESTQQQQEQEQQEQQQEASPPATAAAGRIGKITSMGTRYLSRWVSWSGPPANAPQPSSPKGSPRDSPKGTPIDGMGPLPISPQPPRPYQNRSRASSKASNLSETAPCVYPLVPKLPVPPLGHTLNWYQKHLQCLLTKEQMREVEDIVREFGKPGGLGEKLQEELIKRHDTMDNWIYEWWLDDMYMSVPLPLPCNSNPGMVFPPQNFTSSAAMTLFAARLVTAALEMKERIYMRASLNSFPKPSLCSAAETWTWTAAQYVRGINPCVCSSTPVCSHLTAALASPGTSSCLLLTPLLPTSTSSSSCATIGDLDVDRCSVRERHQPMCMQQYSRVFTSHRRPGIPRDKLLSFADAPLTNQHIVVFMRNHMFRLDVVMDGVAMTTEELQKQLQLVILEVEEYEGPDPPAIGIMTGDNRRTWAQNRQILVSDPTNLSNLKVLETSTLTLCIDEPLSPRFNLTTRTSHKATLSKRQSSFTAGAQPVTPQQEKSLESLRDEVNAGHQMVHGGGSLHNSGNRWFDKTVQFVVTQDGWCGLCYEHSAAEGIVVIQLVEQVLHALSDAAETTQLETISDSAEQRDSEAVVKADPPSHARELIKLEWKVTPVITRRIEEAASNVDRLVEDLDFRILRYTGFGRNFMKKSKCSPDAFIQLALQLAYFRTQSHLTSTYESASIRRFRHGRVDAIRANTPEVLAWCEAMVLNGPVRDRLAKFNVALETQTEIMVNNILGRGIDNHLLGLREVAKEMGLPTPEIFNHSSYQISNHFGLSTSQVPTLSDSWMGYGPVCPDGYGASYNPHPETIVFCLSAWNSCESTSTLDFGRSLERALDDMKTVLNVRQ
ncbi:Acyltransferase ChoActase/COT/CPT [Trinorchestia longiramus]|nr:Acyltransferase ChoActase/COT/CPT [Trinorchestia longiramus]